MDSALITVLTGAGACGVFCVLFVCRAIVPYSVVRDKDREIAELKQARDIERERADTAMTGAQATRDILAAIQLGREIQAGQPGSGGT